MADAEMGEPQKHRWTDALEDKLAALAPKSDAAWIATLSAVGLLTYLVLLGAYPFWDPWEPHYTQVAWEMQEQDTWLNPRYRGLDNWWSKPILLLWLLRSSLSLFWDPIANFADNEFIARLPFALFAVVGGLIQYHWVSRLFGKRIGGLAGLILITAPQYLLIGRQVMIDVPFVVTYAGSLGYLAVGLFAARPAPPAADAPWSQQVLGHWKREYPFVLFWGLQALSVLAKGFVPPALAVIVLASFWAATFRWSDYRNAATTLARNWTGITLKQGIATAAALAALALTLWFMGLPAAKGSWHTMASLGATPWVVGAVLFERTWQYIGLWRFNKDQSWRASKGRIFLTLSGIEIVVRATLWWVSYDSTLFAPLAALECILLAAGIALVTQSSKNNSASSAHPAWLWAALAGVGLALTTACFSILATDLPRPAGPLEMHLYQGIVAASGAVAIALILLRGTPPVQHALALLSRMRAGWGLLLFFAICAPWYTYMSFEHGWPYWNEFIFYHHLGRAAGTIDKPNNTFDYYVLQVGIALFPWSGFLLGALWRFLARSNPMGTVQQRRNLFILLAAALPYLFFTLSGTKFAHYIFPIIPFLGVIVAAALVWLGRDGADEVQLQEDTPALGHTEPQSATLDKRAWWSHPTARGELVIFAALSLVGFGILAHDIVLDFRLLPRLFLYYYNRPTPPDYHPFIELQFIFLPIGVAIGLLLISRWFGRALVLAVSTGAVVLACYLAWVTMPAMQATYSFKPLYEAYTKMAKPREEVGQYNDWQQPVRSVIYLFQNRAKHLRTADRVKSFLRRQQRKFIIVDRNQLPALRRIAREVDKKLYIVFDDHPYGRMVSDVPNEEDSRRVAEFITREAPTDMTPVAADFGDIDMLGYKVHSAEVKPGESVQVSFYYECKKLLDRDWQIFVHGDGPRGGSNRLHIDHFPVDGMYPTTEWQEGEIIEDRFDIAIPADYPFDSFVLWSGFYMGSTRLELSNAAGSDGNNRVRGPRIRVVKP